MLTKKMVMQAKGIMDKSKVTTRGRFVRINNKKQSREYGLPIGVHSLGK